MKRLSSQFTFYGYISNRDSLITRLNLSSMASIEEIAYAAFNTWQLDFNQEVAGDYALILPLENSKACGASATLATSQGQGADKASLVSECFICCSAFASYRLFYRANQEVFELSDRLDPFMDNALLDTTALAQFFCQGYLIPPLTLVKGVRQLANGESQIWQVSTGTERVSVSCLAHQSLSLIEKLESHGLGVVGGQVKKETACLAEGSLSESNLAEGFFSKESLGASQKAELEQLKANFQGFSALPVLARLLQEPVSHTSQLAFFERLLNLPQGEVLISDLGLDEVMSYASSKQSLASANDTWDSSQLIQNKRFKARFKRLFKSPLEGAFKAQRHSQLRLRQRYQSQMLNFDKANLPSFELWLALTITLPNRWQQQRLLAQRLGKALVFSLMETDVLHQVFSSPKALSADTLKTYAQAKPVKAYFDLHDSSLVNPYDAMQRLMLQGFPAVTNQLFKLVPPFTAKLIKQEDPALSTQGFCLQVLTLDHLSRHSDCTIEAT